MQGERARRTPQGPTALAAVVNLTERACGGRAEDAPRPSSSARWADRKTAPSYYLLNCREFRSFPGHRWPSNRRLHRRCPGERGNSPSDFGDPVGFTRVFDITNDSLAKEDDHRLYQIHATGSAVSRAPRKLRETRVGPIPNSPLRAAASYE
jgi:hypothetical protein